MLKTADAGQAAGGSTNFSGEVGERRDVVADDGGGIGELGAGQLHTVAGVAGEAYGYGFDFFEVLFNLRDRRFDNSAHC
jgi:hypothetical protein